MEFLAARKRNLPKSTRLSKFVVDQEPTLAGIDPYNKLIDRNGDDNMINVTKK